MKDKINKTATKGNDGRNNVPAQCLNCCEFFWVKIAWDGEPWECPECGRKNYWYEKTDTSVREQ